MIFRQSLKSEETCPLTNQMETGEARGLLHNPTKGGHHGTLLSFFRLLPFQLLPRRRFHQQPHWRLRFGCACAPAHRHELRWVHQDPQLVHRALRHAPDQGALAAIPLCRFGGRPGEAGGSRSSLSVARLSRLLSRVQAGWLPPFTACYAIRHLRAWVGAFSPF